MRNQPMVIITTDIVERILDEKDDQLRSFMCAQAYDDLAQMIRQVVPFPAPPMGSKLDQELTDDDRREDANFWTFLSWSASSMTANIPASRSRLGGRSPSPAARARRFLTPLAARALADGERFAFSDCARLGVRFHQQMTLPSVPNPEEVAQVCIDELKPQLRSIRDESDIRNGIRALHRAAVVSREMVDELADASKAIEPAAYRRCLNHRSELLLKATIYLDAAEQKLVQHALEEAFHALPNQWLGIATGRTPGTRPRPRNRFSRATTRRVAPLLRDVSSRLATRWVFSVVLPDEVVGLGTDLPLDASGRRFHPRLETIEDLELAHLIGRFDSSYLNGTGTAARDWTNYADRMRFIVNYLRLYQLRIDPDVPPYEPFQARRLRAFHFPWLEPGEDAAILARLQEEIRGSGTGPGGQEWGEGEW